MLWILIPALFLALFAALLPADARGAVAGLIAGTWLRLRPGHTDRELRRLTRDEEDGNQA